MIHYQIRISSDDRILFKNIPDNHTIFVSRDLNNEDMRIETFSTNNPTTDLIDSINTINTEISDGQTGIENIAFTTGDNSYDNEDTVRIEEFYTLGSNDVYEAQVVTGTTIF